MPIISAFPTGESTVDYTGPKSGLPSLEEGKVAYVTDEKRLYTGNADGTNTQVPNEEDVSNAVSGHDSDENAHADKFAKYLPLEGGKMTGAIVVTNNYNKYSALETPTGYTYIDIYDDGKDVTTGTTEMHTVVGRGSGYLTGEHLVMDGAGIDLRRYNGTLANTQVALKLNAESNTVRIEQVGTISDNSDVTTKKYVDDAISEANTNYLPLEGGTMTGSIIAPSNTSAIRNSTNSSRVSIHDETAGLASGTVSVLCNSSNSDNPNLTLSAGSTNLYVSDANGTVQMTRTKDITHDNDITDKKYVDSAIGSIAPSACKVTLSASGWDSSAKTQSATVSGVLEDESKQLIMPMPAGTSMSAYNEAGIQMTAQAANTVTFTADTVPKVDVEVWVVVQAVNDVTPPPPLDQASWDYISKQSLAGNAKNIWAVGDCKKIKLSGTASKLSLNTELYVYILDFDHDSSTVGGTKDGITFGTFKTALTGGKDVCLMSGYSDDSDFRMNTTNANSGGWKNSDMRYNILGSTNTQNGNATATTATSPKSNTLMSCLPADLRAVMRPMCVYTDNTGGGSDTASYVTTTIDFLPLLAEFEIHGTRTSANSAEKNNQTQYAYFKNGSSKVKYRHDSQSSAGGWWSRSPYSTSSRTFCTVTSGGSAGGNRADSSNGVAPAFKV